MPGRAVDCDWAETPSGGPALATVLFISVAQPNHGRLWPAESPARASESARRCRGPPAPAQGAATLDVLFEGRLGVPAERR